MKTQQIEEARLGAVAQLERAQVCVEACKDIPNPEVIPVLVEFCECIAATPDGQSPSRELIEYASTLIAACGIAPIPE